MHGDSSGGKYATGLRRVRGPVPIACLLAAVAGVTVFLPDKRQHDDPTAEPMTGRNRSASSTSSIQRETDPMLREERIAARVDGTEFARIPSVLDELRHGEADPLTDDLVLRLVRRWAESDPAAAAAWVDSLPAGEVRSAALEQVALAWSGRDLTPATAWARGLDDEVERESVLSTIAHEAVRDDPMAALRIAAELPASGSNDELVRRAAMEWASADGQAAADWARGIESTDLRNRALSGVALAWSDLDPVAAATFAVNELPAGRLQSDTVVGIVQRWVQQDPVNAAAWVASFPEGSLRRDALACLNQLR